MEDFVVDENDLIDDEGSEPKDSLENHKLHQELVKSV